MINTPTLPYAYNALEPSISHASVENHFENHHKRYVARVNQLTAKTDLANAGLDEIIKATARRQATSELFSNAAQAWNHDFFWHSMKPGCGGAPTGAIRTQIESDFRGYEDFVAKFKKAAGSVFGSGWVWLVLGANKLKIVTTKDAQTPSTRGLLPIITLDLWEHAYYPDYGPRRQAYVDAYLSSLLSWEFANKNLAQAKLVPTGVRPGMLQVVDNATTPPIAPGGTS